MKNLLFLLADQFRFDALGAENPLVQTPHLDALAEAGARFTRAYTPLPVCAPARQALYTGARIPSARTGTTVFSPRRPFRRKASGPGHSKPWAILFGFIGKWNVSPVDGPEAFGYDTVVSAAQYSDGGAQYTGGWLGCESPVPLEQAKPIGWRIAPSSSSARKEALGICLWTSACRICPAARARRFPACTILPPSPNGPAGTIHSKTSLSRTSSRPGTGTWRPCPGRKWRARSRAIMAWFRRLTTRLAAFCGTSICGIRSSSSPATTGICAATTACSISTAPCIRTSCACR